MWKRRSFLASILGAIGAAPAAGKIAAEVSGQAPTAAEPWSPPPRISYPQPFSGKINLTLSADYAQPFTHNWGLTYGADEKSLSAYAAEPSKSLPGGLEEQRRESENWRNNLAAEHIRYGYINPETMAAMIGKTIAAVVMLPDNCYSTREDALYWPERAQAARLIFTDGTAVDFQPTHDDSRVEVCEFSPQMEPEG